MSYHLDLRFVEELGGQISVSGLGTKVRSVLCIELCHNGLYPCCDASFIATTSPVAQSARRALHRFEAIR